MSAEIVGRVLQRMKELGLNPRSASLASGMSDSAIRDMVRKPGMSPTMQTLEKLASGLQTTPQWLAFGDNDPPDAGSQIVAPTPRPDTRKPDFVVATYGGIVEAGSFREVGEFEDPDRGSDVVPRDDRYPNARYFIFEVAGDSMNAADPPMRPGSRVVAVALEHFRGRLALQTGDIVVIERTRDDGALRERSVKELELNEHETRFCPRSTNSRHQPIIVPKNTEPDEATKVEVLGLVIDVMIKVRRR